MRAFNLLRLITAASALALTGSAFAADVSIAGVYSTKHKVNITDGSKVEIQGMLSIDRDGDITVYGMRVSTATGKDCYYLASHDAVNAQLQGHTLSAGTAPNGEPDYETKIGADTFGIYTQPDPQTGKARWFFHRADDDSLATVSGPEHTVNTNGVSYSITLPRLENVSATDIRMQRCE